MNRVLIVDVSESDRRLMSGLLIKHGYEPIDVGGMEAAKILMILIWLYFFVCYTIFLWGHSGVALEIVTEK